MHTVYGADRSIEDDFDILPEDTGFARAVDESSANDATQPNMRLDAARPDETGADASQLARYELLELAGVGGSGVVYKARDLELGRNVALKFMHREGMRGDSIGRARLRSEAQALARIQHGNVVSVYDVGTYSAADLGGLRSSLVHRERLPARGLYIVMEYVDGATLRTWLAQRPRDWRETLDVLRRAARGLAAAHREGIVHRDFKPGNVLISSNGVRVADFGLASPSSATDAETTAGTPAYMAPEQHLGGTVDTTTDQYAFCTTAWEALAGKHPFQCGDVPTLVARKLKGPPAPPHAGGVPTRIWRVLRRGLSELPADRFASMEALLDELDASPRRRMWRRLAVGFTVGLAAGSSALSLWAAESECAKNVSAIDSVLSEDQPRVPPADRAQVRTVLSERIASWKAARQRTCDPSEDARSMETATACLLGQLQELRAVGEVFSSGEASTLRRSRELVASLSRAENCFRAGHTNGQYLPAPGPARLLSLDIRDQLHRARLLGMTGAAQDRLKISEKTVERAQDADRYTQALALLGRAAARLGISRHEDADADARQAWLLAEQIGADLLAASAAYEVAQIADRMGKSPDEGLRFLDVALARVQRIDPGGEIAIRIAQARAYRLADAARMEEAQRAADDAVAWSEAWAGPDSPQMLDALGAQALVQLRRGRASEALATQRRVVELAVEHFGHESPRTGAAFNNLGQKLQSAGDHEEALHHFQEAAEILTRAYGENHLHVAVVLNNVASALISMGEDIRALGLLEKSARISAEIGGPEHTYVAFPMDNMAGVLRNLGNEDGARTARRRAREIWERTSSAAHPVTRGCILAQAADEAVFRPGPASRLALEEVLSDALDDEAIHHTARADAAFVLARALAPLDSHRASELADLAADLAAPALRDEIERWRIHL